MSYLRVIPRDLFNEGNLLKCYGQLYLNLEKMGMENLLVHSEEKGYFQVEQSQDDGSLWIMNVHLIVRGRIAALYRPLNSRQPYPLWLSTGDDDDYEFQVFTETGAFTPEMIAFLKGK